MSYRVLVDARVAAAFTQFVSNLKLGDTRIGQREPMIDLKTSTKAALDFFNSIYPERHNGTLVEEIELSDDEKYWLITLGFNVPLSDADEEPSALASMMRMTTPNTRRKYKTFKVDRETGEVKAMKIRKV